MTNEQAIQLLEQVTAQVRTGRQEHAAILKAIEVLKALIAAQ